MEIAGIVEPCSINYGERWHTAKGRDRFVRSCGFISTARFLNFADNRR